MKPKSNYAADTNTSHPMDRCQTPPYALNPLLPYLNPEWHVWEPACGEGHLVSALSRHVNMVTGTDLLLGDNFFAFDDALGDVIVTNPPFGVKYQWLTHCIALGKPFALLVPLEMIGAEDAAGPLRDLDGRGIQIEVIIMTPRVDFKMPNAGWSESSAQFPTIWLTVGMNIGKPFTYARLSKPPKQTLAEWDMGYEQKGLFDGAQESQARSHTSQQALPFIS